MRVLEDKQIILRGPKVGRSYAFMLNPEFGWKGKVKNLDDYRKERDDQEDREKQQQRYQESLQLVELSKEQKIIRAIKEGKVDIEKFYNLLHGEQENQTPEF